MRGAIQLCPQSDKLRPAIKLAQDDVMKKLLALIFDVDGTLADTEREGHRVAFNRAFAQAGVDWEWTVKLYGELLRITGGKERIRYFLEHQGRHLARPAQLDQFIADLHAAKTTIYTTMLDEGAIPLRPGIARLLQEARHAGIRLAIATTTTPANVTALLRNTLGAESIGWFDVIASGDIVPKKKPAPDIYTYTLEQLQLDPNACLAFEDSSNGIRSAIGAGVRTLITINDYTAEEDFTEAALVLDQLGEPGNPYRILGGHAASRVKENGWVDIAMLRTLI